VRNLLLSGLGLVLAACGGKPAVSAEQAPAAPAAAPASGSSSAPAPAPEPSPEPAPTPRLPTACANPSAPLCTPPGDFVDRLCAKPHQDVALALFSKSTPFTRLYLRGKMDELVLDEEVLALRFRGTPKGGIVVGSGAGTYDVLRWDGSCSTGVEAEMISRSRPSRPRTAGVKWHRVATRIQDALVASSDAVKRAHARRGKECKGAMSGDVSAACEKADQALVDAVVDYVREGGALPDPDAL
jgi:hypothetical protein